LSHWQSTQRENQPKLTGHTTTPPAAADGDTPVPWLNELEYVEGQVWANVWHTDCIAQIDPVSGQVLGWVLAPGLARRAAAAANGQLDREAVLNGIAYDAAGGRLFLTGKLWPRVYQVELEEVGEGQRGEQLEKARRLCIQRNVRGRRLLALRQNSSLERMTRPLSHNT
jgi:glutamine cyclotransferase